MINILFIGLCNNIRLNELPAPFSHIIHSRNHRIKFNCLSIFIKKSIRLERGLKLT